jgi:hypothetical protein
MTTKPLPWFRFDVAEIATARGGMRVLGDDAALAAMMRFAWRSWREGRLTEDDARQTCGAGFETLLAAMLERGPDGLLSLPWMEAARTEADAYRLQQRESGRRGGMAKAANAKQPSSDPTGSLSDTLAKSTQERRVEESRDSVLQNASHSSGLEPAPRGASPGILFENPKKPKPEAKKGEHVQAVEMFQRAWARIRHGDLTVTVKTDPKDIPPAERYTPTAADFIHAARLWKRIGGDTALLRERMSNFFQSDAPYLRAGGFALFATKFDLLTDPIMALNGSAQPQD